MPTFIYEGKNRFYFGAQARLVENDRETASDWATPHIINNPAHAYVIGRFVEAEKANQNKQYFTLSGLQVARPTITNAPLNVNHSWRNIVGSFLATEMIYPTGEAAATDMPSNPFIESLGVVWRYYFPDEYRMIQAAHASGGLFFSMEAIPESISTIGGSDDSAVYAYDGRVSPNYPEEINSRSVDAIVLNNPHFVGGALIIPPVKPGWSNADVTAVSHYMEESLKEAEMAYESISEAAPDLEASQWEHIMEELLFRDYEAEESRSVDTKTRKKLAKTGAAMPDGSFPIATVADLKNAIRAIGRAKDPAAAKAHVKKRAKALGQSALVPSDWS